MIGELNRENPYIIQIIENIEPTQLKVVNTTKRFTQCIMTQILLSIAIVITCFSVEGLILLIGYNVLSILSTYSYLKRGLMYSPLEEINRIIYGSQYERIYVNNEKLLQLIQQLSGFNTTMDFLINFFHRKMKNDIFMAILICVSHWLIKLVKYIIL